MTSAPLCASARSLTTSARHPRTLLLTLDAFETLFHPRPPVPEQYATTAHRFGLSRTVVTPERVKAAFKDVYRAQAKLHPNYGRADVLRGRYGGPKQWWEEVIRGSFAKVLAADGARQPTAPKLQDDKYVDLPPGLVNALLDRFAGAGGYTLYDDVVPFFARMRELRTTSTKPFDRVVIGVISNSDDRVPDVLKALGLRVGDMRADQDLSSMELPGFEERGASVHSVRLQEIGAKSQTSSDADLDLVITSYEAGEEKPNRVIFDVARRQARLLAQAEAHTHGSTPVGIEDMDDWICVHVGDDYEKDYLAAMDAGWQSYFLARGQNGESEKRPAKTIRSLMDLLGELKIGS
ncbi:hypothetical protein N7462_001836 [Penicillium macrosclerotiorum]|uniref:uncharacterized protein n=1 Tax=Penicillium macrosclerotiorum TaxID=303699 RepID=UPI00254685E3|nr:uncharacterized protein N7462_001836 [Penicillium macrosclerotiorum]KAJ5692413.1 hypothetical protein N7462_001836 [Penicillium macrosclerotiorum]